MSATPSKSADLAKLVAAFVVAALAVALGGWWLLTRTGGVDGRVFHSGDRPASMTIGPNGWFAYSDDEGEWVEHAPTGERWGGERLYGSPVLTSDGTAVSTLGPDVRIARASGLVVTEGSDLLVAHGDKELLPGDEVEVIGLSTQHAAVVSCLSPAGQARLGKDVPGGRLVVSGVALEDGQVDWSHDTEVGCATRLATLYPHGLPEQRHVLLTPAEETTQALDLDTGAIAETWQQAPRGRVIVRQDEAVHRSGDTVSVTSLRSGKELARTSCPGARLDGIGESGGRLAAEGTPLVRCGDSVRLLGDDGFVTVDSPPVEESQEVADGHSVVFDRFLISRSGDSLTLRDALVGKDVGAVDVPEGYRISTNDLRGRLIVFYRPADKLLSDAAESSFHIVDTRTAALVATTDNDLSPGAEVSTDGYAVLGEFVERRRTRPSYSKAWLVGVEDVQRPS
ncbi:hypothetical protein ASG73_07355 [Janibacter sp. Soil728]|uniref:hypothetical protein n=1 Tax=Janibacter sp. Soil728 TaxID=1736393 RepID=UPI0006FEFE7B|nr:hypothetical protein [Janibacter sp. Soil728]KRE37488.1 hypothetical protein ASG73_07355 [Janibacter sp. Soil728]